MRFLLPFLLLLPTPALAGVIDPHRLAFAFGLMSLVPILIFLASYRPRSMLGAVVVATCAFSTTLAFAQSDTTISAGPWVAWLSTYILPAAGLLVTAILGWLAALLQKYTGIVIEKNYRDALHSAAMTGVSSALNYAQARAGNLTVDVRNKVIADALVWMQTSVPDAIKRLGITPGKMIELASSKLAILAEAPSSIPTNTAPTPPNA